MPNQHFLEKCQVQMAIVPGDISAAANNGDWVNMEDYNRLAVMLIKAAGTAGDDPVFTLRQALDNAGTGAKALNFTRIDVKQGVQTAIGQFTTISQAAANTYQELTAAEAQAIYVVDLRAEDLDIDNGFKFVQLQIPDAGAAAQIACGLYILHEPNYQSGALPGAIA